MRHVRFWLPGLCGLVVSGCPSDGTGGHSAQAGAGAPAEVAGATAAGGGGGWTQRLAAGGGAAAGRASDGVAGGAAGAAMPSGGHGGGGGEAMSVAGRSGRGGRSGGGGNRAAAGSGGNAGRAGSAGRSGAAGGDCTADPACHLDAPPSSGDIKQDCVDRINQFRTQCACLPELERWGDGEACADQMAMFDSAEDSAHAGFMMDICKGGNAQNECPGWSSQTQVVNSCLQKMWDEGPPPSTPCTGECFATYGHFINMTNQAMKKVACGFYKTQDDKVWAVQNFSP